jgi:L-threonylcarbamoyladenylate synthase
MNEQGTDLHTIRLLPSTDGIAHAVRLLRSGACVAVPTETVYGLAADATNGVAVAGIYAAKGRPSFNPLIVHVVDIAAARKLVVFSQASETLASAFWPGPLTLVLPSLPHNGIAALVNAGLPSLAVRVPAHTVMQNLLATAGTPLAAPSANASGYLSPTTADHVRASLDGKIAAVLDGGACARGLESTIIGFEKDAPVLLREGAIAAADIEAVLGEKLIAANAGKITAPGQMLHHYAPKKPLRLNADRVDTNEFHIGFGEIAGDVNLSDTGNLGEAAANLFAHLYLAENQPKLRIAIAPVPKSGLGLAINDRLNRALPTSVIPAKAGIHEHPK